MENIWEKNILMKKKLTIFSTFWTIFSGIRLQRNTNEYFLIERRCCYWRTRIFFPRMFSRNRANIKQICPTRHIYCWPSGLRTSRAQSLHLPTELRLLSTHLAMHFFKLINLWSPWSQIPLALYPLDPLSPWSPRPLIHFTLDPLDTWSPW